MVNALIARWCRAFSLSYRSWKACQGKETEGGGGYESSKKPISERDTTDEILAWTLTSDLGLLGNKEEKR